MITFTLRLRAEEPLVITSGSSESMAHETLGYIPGNMLLGAFAAAWKRVHHDMDPDTSPGFRRLFLDGDVSWGMAVPACGDDAGVPVPRSYMRLKNHKGLPESGEEVDGHIVINLLRLRDEDNLTECLRGRGILEEGDVLKLKKYGMLFMGRNSMRRLGEKRGWNIHVALGTQRSAMEGQLFGYSSIVEGTEFLCRVICRDEEAGNELRSLLKATRSFHVGRSRSAGYGRTDIIAVNEARPEEEMMHIAAGEEIAVFLLSHYVPSVSWLQPVESLCEELELLCGERPVLKKKFCSYAEIQGYNAMWKKLRTSRTALEQGGVLLCSFGKDVRLPRKVMLGSCQTEGYGRIELEPEFLRRDFPEIPPMSPVGSRKIVPAPQNSPLWKSVRRRAVDRLCEKQVYALLLEERWQRFIMTVSKNAHPSASQRGNIRRIVTELPQDKWELAFLAMLESSKRAGEQWKRSVALSPFSRGNDYLDVIMRNLLSEKRNEDFQPGINLPGGPADAEELASAGRKAHRLFLLRLLAAWNRACLANNNEGN